MPVTKTNKSPVSKMFPVQTRCLRCNGRGIIYSLIITGSDNMDVAFMEDECWTCDGTGWKPRKLT